MPDGSGKPFYVRSINLRWNRLVSAFIVHGWNQFIIHVLMNEM
jgi:hypothetical protein